MKKTLLLLAFLIYSSGIFAQDRSFMLGIATSYEAFDLSPSYTNYSGEGNVKGFSIGLEYAETMNILGYRAGIFYTRLKDQDIVPFDDLFFIDIFLPVNMSDLEIIDFPVSGQIYLGKKKLKAYGNFGFITSLSFHNNEEYEQYFNQSNPTKSLSFKCIFGGGLTYQIAKHLGVDIGVNRKKRLHTLDDSYIKPYDSFGIQTKVSYIF